MNNIRKYLWECLDEDKPPMISKIREMVRTKVKEYITEKNIDAGIRINRLWFHKDSEMLLCSTITLWNTFCVMDENSFANRISVSMKGSIKELRVSTYEGFLDPFPHDFALFVKKLFDEAQP